MLSARGCLFRLITIGLPLIATLSFQTSPVMAAMGGSQYCRPSSSCTVGEFLYDDNYSPIGDALCLLSTYNPNDTLLFDEVVMATGSAGWYDHEFSAPATEGYYRTQICCYTGGEKLCLDKSFNIEANEVRTQADVAASVWNANRATYNSAGSFGEALQNPTSSTNDIASTVWGFSGRTLSNFGTLVTDIWSASTRSLTGFGTLVSDIWSNPTRTLTSVVDNAAEIWNYSERTLTSLEGNAGDIWNYEERSLTESVDITDNSVTNITENIENTTNETKNTVNQLTADFEGLKGLLLENRDMLERLVNKPIIETSIEEEPDLDEKLSQTDKVQASLATKLDVVKKGLESFADGVESRAKIELLQEVAGLIETIGGQDDDVSRESLAGDINWFLNNWGYDVNEQLVASVNQLRTDVGAMERAVGAGTGQEAAVAKALSSYRVLESLVGMSGSDAGEVSLVAQIRQSRNAASELIAQKGRVEGLIGKWEGMKHEEIYGKAKELSDGVEEVNQLISVRSVYEVGARGLLSLKELKNSVLAMVGVLDANLRVLAARPGNGVANVWLEEGSIVFKALITNPSRRLSQEVPLEYYLPPEIREEDVLEVDPGLTVEYNAERDQFFVKGMFELGPAESVTVAVRTNDIWVIPEATIESLRTQVKELAKPLEKTSYYAQGVTLSSDIDVALNKIQMLMATAVTPEQKIRSYREAELELAGVIEKTEKLKELVTAAGSANNLFGFIGGAQVIAVWGLVIILAAGFVFLALYMRLLRKGVASEKSALARVSVSKVPAVGGLGFTVKKTRRKKPKNPWGIVIPFVGLVVIAVTLASAKRSEKLANEPMVTPLADSGQATNQGAVLGSESGSGKGGVESGVVVVEKGKSVDVYSAPDYGAEVVTALIDTQEVIVVGGYGDWVQVVLKAPDDLGQAESGWLPKGSVTVEKAEDVEDTAAVEQVEPVVEEAEADAVEEVVEGQEQMATVRIGKSESGWLRVRKYPQGPEITKVASGEVYPVVDQEEGWIQVELEDGSEGWVSERYVVRE